MEHSPSWPKFDLVGLPSDPEVPGWLAERLQTPGVPRRILGGEYQVLEAATIVPGRTESLVAFGSSGSSGRVCVDPVTGAVVCLPDPDLPMVAPVNVNLDRFADCVRDVIGLFPLYDDEGELEDFEEAAEKIRQVVGAIDDTGLDPVGFWEDLASDVSMGDYNTEEILDEA